jgi:hypothetical protein
MSRECMGGSSAHRISLGRTLRRRRLGLLCRGRTPGALSHSQPAPDSTRSAASRPGGQTRRRRGPSPATQNCSAVSRV